VPDAPTHQSLLAAKQSEQSEQSEQSPEGAEEVTAV
jgi:hypothetical protein